MSIRVDALTNSLMVAAPDALFREVKQLVEQLDHVAMKSHQTLETVPLHQTNPRRFAAPSPQWSAARCNSAARRAVPHTRAESRAVSPAGVPGDGGGMFNQGGEALASEEECSLGEDFRAVDLQPGGFQGGGFPGMQGSRGGMTPGSGGQSSGAYRGGFNRGMVARPGPPAGGALLAAGPPAEVDAAVVVVDEAVVDNSMGR